jgi:sialic acid synthase SpsE
LDITQLKELVSSIRKAEIVMGERKIMVYEKEKEMLKKLRKQN